LDAARKAPRSQRQADRMAETKVWIGGVAPVVMARRDAAKQSLLTLRQWIASRSLSSAAHSRDPLARNDRVEITISKGGRLSRWRQPTD
jgi:hypothetical protein